MSVPCSRCGREATAAAVVRCQTADCPLRSVPQRLPAGQFAMMLGAVGLLLAAIVGGFAWLVAPGRASAPEASAEIRIEDVQVGPRPLSTPVAQPTAGWAIEAQPEAKRSWSDILLGRRPPEHLPAPPPPSGPDWTASERVASFTCSGTISASRRAICTSWPLATADYNLTLIYRGALDAAANPVALRQAQHRWLGQIDAADGDTKQILALYDARGAEIAAH